NPIFVELEADRINWRLLAASFLGVLVEVADGNRPALQALESRLAGCSIGRVLFARTDLTTDDRQRVVDLFAGFRAVIDGKIENGFSLACGFDRSPDMFGRKHHPSLKVERLFLRLRYFHRQTIRAAFGAAVDPVDLLLIDVVLRVKAKALCACVFPGHRAQIAERYLALAIVKFRDLPEFQRVAVTGTAGKVIEDTPAHGLNRALAVGSSKREI